MGKNKTRNNKQENKPVETEYKCPICQEQHRINQICPIVHNKLHNSKPENRIYIFGNIILECIKRNVDYHMILEEIVYWDTMCSIKDWMRMFNADLMINYFAAALECSPTCFLKKAEKTNEEYVSLLDVDYSSEWEMIKGEDGKTECVIMPLEIYGNEEILNKKSHIHKGSFGLGVKPYLSLYKEKKGRAWEYILKLNSAAVCLDRFNDGDSRYQERFCRHYLMSDMDGSDRDFTLAVDRNGKLKDFFEENIDTHWTKIAEMVSVSDVRFSIWIEKLTKATQQGLIGWRKTGYGVIYHGSYAENEIKITLSNGRSKKDILYIRLDWDYAIGFTVLPEERVNILSNVDGIIEELRQLSKVIEESIKFHENSTRLNALPQKELEYSDVVAVTNSMICKEHHHSIIPYKGLVPFLNKENEIVTYTVYVGYCKECKRFYMFATDFKKMFKEGKPLCRVIRLDKGEPDKDNSVVGFKYKSESVLHALGYNVRANNNLSDAERQKILLNAVEYQLLQVHEILDFLNWLIRVNEVKRGYSGAVDKWKMDIEFVRTTVLQTADVTEIDTIYVKGKVRDK